MVQQQSDTQLSDNNVSPQEALGLQLIELRRQDDERMMLGPIAGAMPIRMKLSELYDLYLKPRTNGRR